MVLLRRFQKTLALLAGVTTLYAAVVPVASAQAQAPVDVTTTDDPPVTLQKPQPVDPCVTLVSPALRMARGCVDGVTMNPDYNLTLPPRNLHPSTLPLLISVEEAAALTGRVSPLNPLALETPYTPLPSCMNMTRRTHDRLPSGHYGPEEITDPNTIVVWGRRDCRDDREMAAMFARQQKEQFGQPVGLMAQLDRIADDNIGRSVAGLVTMIGLGAYGDRAGNAASDAVLDEVVDLFMGGRHGCEDPMERPERRRDREFMGRFIAQQQGVVYDSCRR